MMVIFILRRLGEKEDNLTVVDIRRGICGTKVPPTLLDFMWHLWFGWDN